LFDGAEKFNETDVVFAEPDVRDGAPGIVLGITAADASE
jgi:hypothetical protein